MLFIFVLLSKFGSLAADAIHVLHIMHAFGLGSASISLTLVVMLWTFLLRLLFGGLLGSYFLYIGSIAIKLVLWQ